MDIGYQVQYGYTGTWAIMEYLCILHMLYPPQIYSSGFMNWLSFLFFWLIVVNCYCCCCFFFPLPLSLSVNGWECSLIYIFSFDPFFFWWGGVAIGVNITKLDADKLVMPDILE